MTPILELQDLSFRYEGGLPGEKVLDALTFAVAPGERVGLVGCNGVGKSTLLKILVGILPIQLASIAGILTLDPALILMDEPSAALDPRNRRALIGILNALPCAKLIASHDLDFIYDTCDRVLLLHHGQLAADGPAREILRDKALLERCELELPLRWQRDF